MDDRGKDILNQFLHALPEDTRTAFLEEVFRSLEPAQRRRLLETLRQLTEAGGDAQTGDPPAPGTASSPGTGASAVEEPNEGRGGPSGQADETPDDTVDETWSAAMEMGKTDSRVNKATMRRQLAGCFGLLALGTTVVLLLSWLLRYAFDRITDAL